MYQVVVAAVIASADHDTSQVTASFKRRAKQ
jgi:hypothetical protein